MKHRRRIDMTVRPHERGPTPIIHTAAVAGSSVAEGQLIPYLVLDTTKRPDFVHLVAAHEDLPPGDVDSTWAFIPKKSRSISLLLEFKKPSELFMRLEFGIVEWGGIVDQIMRTRLVYLQPGEPGERFNPKRATPRILVEVMAEPFQEEWDQILVSKLGKDLRKRGLSKKKASRAAKEMIKDWRSFTGFRLES